MDEDCVIVKVLSPEAGKKSEAAQKNLAKALKQNLLCFKAVDPNSAIPSITNPQPSKKRRLSDVSAFTKLAKNAKKASSDIAKRKSVGNGVDEGDKEVSSSCEMEGVQPVTKAGVHTSRPGNSSDLLMKFIHTAQQVEVSTTSSKDGELTVEVEEHERDDDNENEPTSTGENKDWLSQRETSVENKENIPDSEERQQQKIPHSSLVNSDISNQVLSDGDVGNGANVDEGVNQITTANDDANQITTANDDVVKSVAVDTNLAMETITEEAASNCTILVQTAVKCAAIVDENADMSMTSDDVGTDLATTSNDALKSVPVDGSAETDLKVEEEAGNGATADKSAVDRTMNDAESMLVEGDGDKIVPCTSDDAVKKLQIASDIEKVVSTGSRETVVEEELYSDDGNSGVQDLSGNSMSEKATSCKSTESSSNHESTRSEEKVIDQDEKASEKTTLKVKTKRLKVPFRATKKQKERQQEQKERDRHEARMQNEKEKLEKETEKENRKRQKEEERPKILEQQEKEKKEEFTVSGEIKYVAEALQLVRPEKNVSCADLQQHNHQLATTIQQEYYRVDPYLCRAVRNYAIDRAQVPAAKEFYKNIPEKKLSQLDGLHDSDDDEEAPIVPSSGEGEEEDELVHEFPDSSQQSQLDAMWNETWVNAGAGVSDLSMQVPDSNTEPLSSTATDTGTASSASVGAGVKENPRDLKRVGEDLTGVPSEKKLNISESCISGQHNQQDLQLPEDRAAATASHAPVMSFLPDVGSKMSALQANLSPDEQVISGINVQQEAIPPLIVKSGQFGMVKIVKIFPDSSAPEGGKELLVMGEWPKASADTFTIQFNDVSVPAERILTEILRCDTPAHSPGIVKLSVLCNGEVITEKETFTYTNQDRFICNEGIAARWKSELYKNYMKVMSAFYFLKEDLGTFCEDVLADFQKRLLTRHNIARKECANPACSSKKITNGILNPPCANHICSVLLPEIIQEHKQRNNPKLIFFSNCQVQLWTTDFWEIAKVFMSGEKMSDNHGPDDTDAAGILQILSLCRLFWQYVPTADVDQLLFLRNKLIHTGKRECSHSDTVMIFNAMTDFLKKLKNVLITEGGHESFVNLFNETLEKLDELETMDVRIYLTCKAKNINHAEVKILKECLNTHHELISSADDFAVRVYEMNSAVPVLKMVNENSDLMAELGDQYKGLISLCQSNLATTAAESVVPNDVYTLQQHISALVP